MNTFGSLYCYECKKIWDRKLTKISFALCLVLVIVTGTVRLFGNYVVDGEVIGSAYDEIRVDQSYAAKLDNRAINQQLLEEMVTAYRKIPDTPGKHYTSSPEYQKYARPYSEIFNFVVGSTNLLLSDVFLNWEPNEQDLYEQRNIWLEKNWDNMKLSESEINFWRQRENEIEKPIVFQQHEGYSQMVSAYQTIAFLVILFVSIALSGIFPEEHSRRTDQLVLSSPMGRKKLYWAKITAGISYAAVTTLAFFTVISLLMFSLYGSEGFGAAFQLLYHSNSDPITCGQALLIAYANMMIAAIFVSIIVMILSELFHSSMAALAISAGMLIASMIVSVPEYYRVFAQIWNWLPWSFLAPWNVFGKYTLSAFGIHLTPWQSVPLIYALLSVAVAWGGKSIYQRYQVSGR